MILDLINFCILFWPIETVLDYFKWVSIDSLLHDSCTLHTLRSLRRSKKIIFNHLNCPAPNYQLYQLKEFMSHSKNLKAVAICRLICHFLVKSRRRSRLNPHLTAFALFLRIICTLLPNYATGLVFQFIDFSPQASQTCFDVPCHCCMMIKKTSFGICHIKYDK
jgi:hypothetical protein